MISIYKSSEHLPLTDTNLNSIIKDALSWDVKYEDTDKIIIQNANQTNFLCSENVDNGINKISALDSYNEDGSFESDCFVYIKYRANIGYAIITDENSCYIKIAAGEDVDINNLYYFGNFASTIPGDTHNFIIMGYDNDLNAINMLASKGIDSNNKAMCSFSYTQGFVDVPYKFFEGVYAEKPWIMENGKPRGKLPGYTIFKHNVQDIMQDIGIVFGTSSIGNAVTTCNIDDTNYIAIHTKNDIVMLDVDAWYTL